MSNKSTDFTHPIDLQGDGTIDIICEMKLKPHLQTNKNSIYLALGNGSLSTKYNKVAPGTYSLTVPRSWFNRNNGYITIQVDTYDANNKFVSGSFSHSILLYNPKYKNYLSNFLYPLTTYPGEICTINILPPKDAYANGLKYDVDINYHRDVGRETISTNRSTGKFSFVTPELAINSSLTVRVTTKDAKTGSVLGTIAQSIKVAPSNFKVPEIILPDNYTLSITEGVNAKIKGTSENINDYKIIYTKQHCDVAQAVSKYTTVDGYYAASQSELKSRLLDYTTNSPEYFILKDFDQSSTFITQDTGERNIFHIRTPETKDQKQFEDFYALQWFKNIEPSDLIHLYAIERGKRYMNISEAPNTRFISQVSMSNWKCDHCQANDYRYWNIQKNWNPYGRIPTSSIKTALNQYQDITLTLRITMDRQLNYPPNIYITNTSSNDETGAVYLTPISKGPSKIFDYTVPVYYVVNQISNGQTYLYLHTHWGQNTNLNQARYLSGIIDVKTAPQEFVPTEANTYYKYSNNNFDNIIKIPTSSMTPYIVLPPAVRPIELTVYEQTERQLTLSYTNPLHGIGSSNLSTYEKLGSVSFDMSSGDDLNDLSDLNENDYTLDLNRAEYRELTYEKKIKMSSDLIEKINKTLTNSLYIDLNISSVDNASLNFKPIANNDIKVQVMFSNDDNNKIRVLDIGSNLIDLKKSQYNLKKINLNKALLTGTNFNTIHMLYNIDPYDQGKAFKTEHWEMLIDGSRIIENIGWRRFGTSIGSCKFVSNTYDVSRYAIGYYNYELRLCLENISISNNKELYKAPKIIAKHRNGETQLAPSNLGVIKPGEDITYKIPKELYDPNYDEVIEFTMSPETPYPIDIPDISFTNAYVEVIGMDTIEEVIDKFSSGFTASIDFFQERKDVSNANISLFDPVQCVDVILCCYDEEGKLINRTANKRRDIYNGKEFIYYSDRKWHNFFNEKYKHNTKYQSSYRMTFNIPENTKQIYAMAFTYGNWHDNPSIYSMSNIITSGSTNKNMSLEFVTPNPVLDDTNNSLYANVNRNNPSIEIKINAPQNNIQLLNELKENKMNLATSNFNLNTWKNNPLIYSINKQYGYEQPIFNAIDLYRQNNVLNALEPLYNNIEYYSQWSSLYGTTLVNSPNHNSENDVVDIESLYTIYEDEGDKYISNRGVPYIEIPANLFNYDRTCITLFLDTDFGVNNAK